MRSKTSKLLTFLLVGVFVVSFVSLCYGAEAPQPKELPVPTKFNEAPMLRTRVATGELPPVEKRLPEVPLVVDVLDEIGQYGGTIRSVHSWEMWDTEMWHINRESLVEPFQTPEYFSSQMMPNILLDIETSDDAKTFTCRLRKGMKWSDGVPVTTEDVLFWYEDFLLNEKLTPVFPKAYTIGGKPMKLEIIDDYSFRIVFPEAYGLFPAQLHYAVQPETLLPKHYMKQFHPRYTLMEKLEPLIKEAGLEKGNWWVLFNRKNIHRYGDINADIGYPSLSPWIIVSRPGPGITVYERNPYYWKVDAAGNQLPYIDTIRLELVADMEVASMKVLTGEVNFEREEVSLLANYPLYKQNEEKGNYRALPLQSELCSPCSYLFNYTYPDPVVRSILRDVRFRRALSLGIDRQAINESVFLGLGTPTQATVLPGPFYEEEYAKVYIKYDPAEANRILDEMGLDKRDKAGWRLRADGERLILPIDVRTMNATIVPGTEIVLKNWRELGIDTNMTVVANELWQTRLRANQIIVTTAHVAEVLANLWLKNPMFFVPLHPWWAPEWAKWYNTNGEQGEEPIPEMKRIYELWDKIRSTPSDEERTKMAREIVRSQAENLWVIGTVGNVIWPVIVDKNMKNVPEKGLAMWVPNHAEQVFISQK